ncbi:MAG: methionine ABC transporter permease [Pseudoclavibacter sp.]
MSLPFDTLVQYLLQNLGVTLYMVAITMVISGFIGLVLGIVLYGTRPGRFLQNRAVYDVVSLLVNIFRPIPFVILVFAIGPLTRLVIGTTIGDAAAIFAMVIGGAFFIGRIVEQNLVSIDPGVIEAAQAMGASRFTIVRRVLLRESLAPLILGYTFIFIAIVDMSAMVGTVGGGGLGNFALVYGYQRFNWVVTYSAVVVIIVLVQIVQLFGNWLARRAEHV